jgi:DNA-binding CsgD family transcriptional regulator
VIQKDLVGIVTLASAEYPTADFTFLDNRVYSAPLTEQERQRYVQLLDFACALQIENPVYEAAYHHLLHLFVLNGSRLELLSSIDRRVRGLASGQGTLVLVSGVSGIGKTSLVMAYEDRVRQLGAEFVAVRCTEREGASLALWHDVVRAVAAVTDSSTDAIVFPLGSGPEARSSQELKQSLIAWLHGSAAAKPIAILLDDLHWADADSLAVLEYLTRQPGLGRLLYIATYRSEELQSRRPLEDLLPQLRHNRQVDHIRLKPLTLDDVVRLVTAQQGPCSPELAVYLYDSAEGHPLFTVELLNDLADRDLLTQDQAGRWLPPGRSVAVPAFLKQLIMRRVGRLGAPVEQVLSIAAVAGEIWQLNIIEPLTAMAELDLLSAVEAALRAEIVAIEDDKAEIYRFSHGLIRQVLYTGQLARRRKRLHEQIAAQFEQQQPTNVFAIAHHYCEAERWEKAAGYCLAAGEQSVQRFANYSALHWYRQALNAVERASVAPAPEMPVAIYERLGRTYMALEQREEAEIIYGRLREIAQGSGDLIAEGHALLNLANVRTRLYQLDRAEQAASAALNIGEEAGDLRLLTHSHACLGGVLLTRGELERATHHYRLAMQNADLLGDSGQLLDMLRLLAYQATWAGQYAEAEDYARRTLTLARKVVDPLAVAGACTNLGFVQIETGQYHAAYQNLCATLDALAASGVHHHQKPRILNLLGYLHLELGHARAALTWDQSALEAARSTQGETLEMHRYALLNIATDYLHLGQLEEALDTVRQFEAIRDGAEFVRFRYFNRYQLLLCEIHLAQKKSVQAIELAHEARALAQAKGVPKNIARSHWLEGQALAGMHRFGEALRHLEEAVAIADDIRHGSLPWKIRLSLAETAMQAGKSPDVVLRQARAELDETIRSLSGSPLEAIFLASDWVKRMAALEQRQIPKSPTVPAGLTQREVEVLQLVARGASNQQVADALQISVRTVNTHMTNILNKTGLENRTAASSYAMQHNLLP